MTTFERIITLIAVVLLALTSWQVNELNKRINHLESVTFGSSRCVK